MHWHKFTAIFHRHDGLRPNQHSHQNPPTPSQIRVTLNDDILLKILCLCDLATLLCVSQVCRFSRIACSTKDDPAEVSRRLYALACSRAIWVHLVSDLHRRNLVELIPEQSLEDTPTDALIKLVKRAVQGPRSWRKSSNSEPIITRVITLNTNCHQGWQAPALLPGGRFVVFVGSGRLRCWSVLEDRLLWEYKGRPEWTAFSVKMFAAEAVEEGRAIMLVICVRVHAECVHSLTCALSTFRLI
jgi:hypothetical protein